jgi:hypothetical protein
MLKVPLQNENWKKIETFRISGKCIEILPSSCFWLILDGFLTFLAVNLGVPDSFNHELQHFQSRSETTTQHGKVVS